MMLPTLPVQIQRSKMQTVQFLGLNLTQNTQEGEFADMRGLSTSKYPLITQRNRRTQINSPYIDVKDIYAWDRHLYVVDKTSLLKDETEIYSDLEPGRKSMAVINSKLVIWQDKIYVDLKTYDVYPLAESDEYETWAIIYPNNDSTSPYLYIQATGIGAKFPPGKVVDLSATGLSGTRVVAQAPSGVTVGNDDLYILVSAVEYTPPVSGNLSVTTSLPDLDFICSSNNRIWGCNISENTVYASALGDPTDFFNYASGDIGPYAVTVGSEGAFTGICEYNGAVCVWKEKVLHKIMGSFPSEFYMNDSTIDGVQAGSERSLTVINQTLFYKGIHGVYTYAGGRPQCISYNLGDGVYKNAVGGTDGSKYYINMTNPSNVSHLYVYDLKHGLWAIEDVENEESNVAMANLDDRLYMVYQLSGVGKLRYINTGVYSGTTWYGEFVPMYEDMFNRKGYLRLLIRMDMTTGSSVTVKVKEDNKAWKTVWTQTAVNTVPVMVPVRLGRCDKYTLRLEGTGEVTVRTIGREHVTGSVIN